MTDTVLALVKDILLTEGHISNYHTIFTGINGRHPTRLAATIHTLRHRHGMDIETRVEQGRLAHYYLKKGKVTTMGDQTQRAAAYFRSHSRVSRLDLWTAGILRPDREVARLIEEGWDLVPFESGEDPEDPRLGGWLVSRATSPTGRPTSPQGTPEADPTPRVRWVCTKPGCGLDALPDEAYTMLDDKGRMTTGKCPKHGRPVLLRRA